MRLVLPGLPLGTMLMASVLALTASPAGAARLDPTFGINGSDLLDNHADL